MAKPLKPLAAGMASFPGRIRRVTGWWAHLEAPGLGAEAERRREREVWRQGVDDADLPTSA